MICECCHRGHACECCDLHRPRPYNYKKAAQLYANILGDMRILAGDDVGPSGVSWQDVAGTLAVNLRVLANSIEQARAGNVKDGPVVFPSPDDV